MSRALILSSHVAASRVGGYAQSLALSAFGVDPVLVPTVLFGRHPGWGPPGGGAVDPAMFRALIGGVEAQIPLSDFDAVICGYFSHPDQVMAAAAAIDSARLGGTCRIIVDPILGDTGKGLYVRPEVAEAVITHLVPRADLLTPNLWELGHITGRQVTSLDETLCAARQLSAQVVVTSAPAEAGRIGVLDVTADAAWLFTHPKWDTAPSGTGDLLTALLTAAELEMLQPPEALARALSGLIRVMQAAQAQGAGELPVAAADFRVPALAQGLSWSEV
jgi:pyridoxine kinase